MNATRKVVWAFAIFASLQIVCTSGALAQQYELLIGYSLPENADLNAAARDLEAKARTQRLAAVTICSKNPDVRNCDRDAEMTFRGLLLADSDITFALYVSDGSGPPRWLLNLGPKTVIARDFDLRVAQLQSGTESSLGIHVESLHPCQVLGDANSDPIPYDLSAVCELIAAGSQVATGDKAPVEFLPIASAPEDDLDAMFTGSEKTQNEQGGTKEWQSSMTTLDRCHFLYLEDLSASWGDYYHFKANGSFADLDPIGLDVYSGISPDRNWGYMAPGDRVKDNHDRPQVFWVLAQTVDKAYKIKVTGYQAANTYGKTVTTNYFVYFMAKSREQATDGMRMLIRRITQCASKGQDSGA